MLLLCNFMTTHIRVVFSFHILGLLRRLWNAKELLLLLVGPTPVLLPPLLLSNGGQVSNAGPDAIRGDRVHYLVVTLTVRVI
jgi:hypothetical protein